MNKNNINSLKNKNTINNNDNTNYLNNSKIKQNKIKDNKNIRAIISKVFSSNDKKLNICLNYYEYNYEQFYNNNKFNSSLRIIFNDSITLLNTTITIKNNNKNYLQVKLNSIKEEDEKSKINPSINNSNSFISEENTQKYKSYENKKYNLKKYSINPNLVIYLTKILENLYDDNRKMILYPFMRNLKKIQSQSYLKNSLYQYNSTIINEDKENSIYNNINKNKENYMIKTNGKKETELSNEISDMEKNHFFTPDNSLLDGKINNQKNMLIGSLLFKDFEIKDDDYNWIKTKKKSFSSSYINQISNNGSEKKEINNKNLLGNIIIEINNKKIINYYYKYWKQIKNINYNDNRNKNIENGMNNEDIKKENNNINKDIIGLMLDIKK